MTVRGIDVRAAISLWYNSITSRGDSRESSGNRYGISHSNGRNSHDDNDELILSVGDNVAAEDAEDATGTDDLSELRRVFTNQITRLNQQREAETSELLAKLDDITEQFQVLSEESADTIQGLEKKVATMSSRLGRMLSGLDRPGSGTHVALRDISRLRQVASLGGGALDKLMRTLGNVEGKPLQELQQRNMSTDKSLGIDHGNSSAISLLA